jgi:hypothetical protein
MTATINEAWETLSKAVAAGGKYRVAALKAIQTTDKAVRENWPIEQLEVEHAEILEEVRS